MQPQSKPLVIGQAPGPGKIHVDDKDLGALAGSTGRRFAHMLGISFEEYIQTWDRKNLLNEFLGESGKGDKWDATWAWRSAREMTRRESEFVGRPIVVLLGRNVHRAFDFTKCELVHMIVDRHAKLKFLLMPHPSGVSRWWNDAHNSQHAERVLRGALAHVKDKRCKPLKSTGMSSASWWA